jgi:hypothetical protein
MIQTFTDFVAIAKFQSVNGFGERVYTAPAKIRCRLSSERVRTSQTASESSSTYVQVVYSFDEITVGDRIWLSVDDVDFDDPDDIAAKLTDSKSSVILSVSYHKTPMRDLHYYKGEL